MSEKANVIVRFAIESFDLESQFSIQEVSSLMPNPKRAIVIASEGERDFKNGKGLEPFPRKTSMLFEDSYSVSDIEICNQGFLKAWENKTEVLELVKGKFNYELTLNYEVTVFNLNYPSMVFSPEFSEFLSGMGITFSLYFYHDDGENIA